MLPEPHSAVLDSLDIQDLELYASSLPRNTTSSGNTKYFQSINRFIETCLGVMKLGLSSNLHHQTHDETTFEILYTMGALFWNMDKSSIAIRLLLVYEIATV